MADAVGLTASLVILVGIVSISRQMVQDTYQALKSAPKQTKTLSREVEDYYTVLAEYCKTFLPMRISSRTCLI
jgi:hypothetical protein